MTTVLFTKGIPPDDNLDMTADRKLNKILKSVRFLTPVKSDFHIVGH